MSRLAIRICHQCFREWLDGTLLIRGVTRQDIVDCSLAHRCVGCNTAVDEHNSRDFV